jgi:hypothetical protein
MIGLGRIREAGSSLFFSRTSSSQGRLPAFSRGKNPVSAISTVIAVLPETTANVTHYLTSCHLTVVAQ